MDYEKKYKEALERAKEIIECSKSSGSKEVRMVLSFFPELRENEDERIRKELLDMCKTLGKSEWIAWLEKQVGQKPAMIQWKGDNLKEVIDFTGVYKEGFEKWFHNSWEEYEKYVHEHNNIFKIFNEDGSHIEVPVGAWIVKTPDGYNTASRYVFRQKPAWSEEDERIVQNLLSLWKEVMIEPTCCRFGLHKDEVVDFLKSLKDRVQPVQEWNGGDDAHIHSIITHLQDFIESHPNTTGADIQGENVAWLKSLRPQNHWKPSKEQMEALEYFIINHNEHTGYAKDLEELRQNLKKLKE